MLFSSVVFFSTVFLCGLLFSIYPLVLVFTNGFYGVMNFEPFVRGFNTFLWMTCDFLVLVIPSLSRDGIGRVTKTTHKKKTQETGRGCIRV